MIKEFPAFAYRCPGPYCGPHGQTYETLSVATPEALAEAIRNRWHWSLDEAARGLVAQPEPVPEPMPEPMPDTRAGLHARAVMLGIDVDGRWSEKRLRKEIDAAIQATSL